MGLMAALTRGRAGALASERIPLIPTRGPGSERRTAGASSSPTSRTPSMSDTLPYATFRIWVSSVVVASSG